MYFVNLNCLCNTKLILDTNLAAIVDYSCRCSFLAILGLKYHVCFGVATLILELLFSIPGSGSDEVELTLGYVVC